MLIRRNFLESILRIGAIVLIFVVITNISMHVAAWDMWREALWYCNVGAFFLGIGILTKNKFICTSVLATTIPTQFFWIFDFILEIFGLGLGRTSFMFEGMVQWNMFVFPILLHTLIIPLALIAVYLYGFSSRSIVMSLLFFGLLLLTFTYISTNPADNINCVFFPCDLNYYKNFAYIASHSQYISTEYFIKFLAFWGSIISAIHLILYEFFVAIKTES